MNHVYICMFVCFVTLVFIANLLALYCVIRGIDLVHIMCDDNSPLLSYMYIYIRIHHCMSVVIIVGEGNYLISWYANWRNGPLKYKAWTYSANLNVVRCAQMFVVWMTVLLV